MVTGPFTPFWANAVAAANIVLKLPDPDKSTEYDPDIGVWAESVKLVIKRVDKSKIFLVKSFILRCLD